MAEAETSRGAVAEVASGSPRPNGPPSDDELLERARAGDERAFGMLVDRYEPRVAATVIGMLGPGDDAEDVGQETFIRFYRSLDSFRGEASLGTYLTRIAVNRSLTALRRRRRWLSRFKRREEGAAEPAAGAGPEDDVIGKERAAAVRAAIDSLGPGQRAVVVLRMIDGRSTRETAEILGIPEGTVMSRLYRAMGRLETLLEGTRDE